MKILREVYGFLRRNALLLVGLLLTSLVLVSGRKSTRSAVVPKDADNNGQEDEHQIQDNLQQADSFREAAADHVDAAVAVTQRPTVVEPSKNVREAVQRNNDVDY